MIEKWLQVTCDGCGETDNSTAPNMTISEYRADLKLCGWATSKGKDYCGLCRVDLAKSEKDS